MNDIVVYQSKTSSDWTAKRKGSADGAPRGKGDSSLEAHGNLLEREEAAGMLRKERT